MFLETSQNITVITDDISASSGMNKCFEAIEDTYALILQDDILPCADLIKTANKLVKIKPHSFISLFSANSIIEKAVNRKRNWVKIDKIYGLCAYIIPHYVADAYLEYKECIKDDIRADDVRISMFIKDHPDLFDVYLTAPSLVEHLGFFDSVQRIEKSRIGRANIVDYRIANYFIGFEKSGLSIDWGKTAHQPIDLKIGQKYDYIRHKKNTSD